MDSNRYNSKTWQQLSASRQVFLDGFCIEFGDFESQGPLPCHSSPQFIYNNTYWKLRASEKLELQAYASAEFCFDTGGANSEVYYTRQGGASFLPQDHPELGTIEKSHHFWGQFNFTPEIQAALNLPDLPGDILQIYSTHGDWFDGPHEIRLIWSDSNAFKQAPLTRVQCSTTKAFVGFGHCIPSIDISPEHDKALTDYLVLYAKHWDYRKRHILKQFCISSNLKIGGLSCIAENTRPILCGIYTVSPTYPEYENGDNIPIPDLLAYLGIRATDHPEPWEVHGDFTDYKYRYSRADFFGIEVCYNSGVIEILTLIS